RGHPRRPEPAGHDASPPRRPQDRTITPPDQPESPAHNSHERSELTGWRRPAACSDGLASDSAESVSVAGSGVGNPVPAAETRGPPVLVAGSGVETPVPAAETRASATPAPADRG